METTEAFPIKKSPVVLTIIFNVLTLGIYSCCWFLIRRKGFNKVSKSEKLGINIFIIGLILRIVIIMLYTASGVFETEGTQDALATEENIKLVAALLRLVFVVILIVQSFKAKAMLEEYRQNKDQFSTPLSGTATFFSASTIFSIESIKCIKINRTRAWTLPRPTHNLSCLKVKCEAGHT